MCAMLIESKIVTLYILPYVYFVFYVLGIFYYVSPLFIVNVILRIDGKLVLFLLGLTSFFSTYMAMYDVPFVIIVMKT